MAYTDTLDQVADFVRSEASAENIYKGEGTSLSQAGRRRNEDFAYQQKLLAVFDLYEAVLNGDREAGFRFVREMNRSDFAFVFGDIIDRQMLAAYLQQPVQWTAIAKSGTVSDFRNVKRFTLDGGQAVLDEVGEESEYPAASLTDAFYQYAVRKFGRRIGLSWETLVNDDLDMFRDLPQRLGNAARRSEEKFATDLYTGSSGPDATFFSIGNANRTDVQLNVDGLKEAFRMLGEQRDTDGAPIYIEAATLVVPPSLEVPALDIVNATEIRAADGGGPGTGNNQLTTANWLKNKVSVIVNPWLPIVDTTSGSTAWYLFANPNVGRPAMEIGRLRGHEAPELFMKTPNATRVSGGSVDATEGSFENDSIEWKVRHVMGGVLMDPKSALASTGTGS